MTERRHSTQPLFEAPPKPDQIDALTGLPNRAWLTEELDRLTNQQPGNFSLLFLDVDGLKKENDTNGHDAGDELIQTTGSIIARSIRSNDHLSAVTRLGGDEFVAIMPGLNTTEDLEIIKTRIRQNLAQSNIRASMGGRAHQVDESSTDLLKSADILMYQDKQAGKAERIRQLPRRKRAALKIANLLNKYASLDDAR